MAPGGVGSRVDTTGWLNDLTRCLTRCRSIDLHLAPKREILLSFFFSSFLSFLFTLHL